MSEWDGSLGRRTDDPSTLRALLLECGDGRLGHQQCAADVDREDLVELFDRKLVDRRVGGVRSGVLSQTKGRRPSGTEQRREAEGDKLTLKMTSTRPKSTTSKKSANHPRSEPPKVQRSSPKTSLTCLNTALTPSSLDTSPATARTSPLPPCASHSCLVSSNSACRRPTRTTLNVLLDVGEERARAVARPIPASRGGELQLL